MTKGFRTAVTEVVSGLDTVEARQASLKNKIGKASGIAAGALAVGAAGVAVESIKEAATFQTAMTRLVTAAGEAKDQIGNVGKGVLKIAQDTGTKVGDLSKGMYMIESAGFHGAAGLTVLKAAAQGAKVENADLGSVGNSLTTVMNDLGAGSKDAAKLMSQMVATVGHGKMTMDDLAGSIHSVLPNAAALHISFPQVAGALATMTAQGISADQAAQNLNHTIVKLAAPTAGMTKAMATYGLSSADVAKQLGKKGLTGTFDELEQAIMHHMGPAGTTLVNTFNQSKSAAADMQIMMSKMPPTLRDEAQAYMAGHESLKSFTAGIKAQGGQAAAMGIQFLGLQKAQGGFNELLKSGNPAAQTFTAAMKNMLGDQTGLQVALHLTGEHAKTFSDNVKAIAGTTTEADGSVKDWSETQKTFRVQLDRVKELIQVTAIQIGTKLLPVVTEMAQWLANHKQLLIDVAIAMTALLTVMASYSLAMKLHEMYTVAVAKAQWLLNLAMDANPLGLLVLGIAALVVGLKLAYDHSETFRKIVNAVGQALKTALIDTIHAVVKAFEATMTFFEGFFGNVEKVFKAAGTWLEGVGSSILHGLLNGLNAYWHFVYEFYVGIPMRILGYFVAADLWLIGKGQDVIVGLMNGFGKAWHYVADWIGGIGRAIIGSLANAGSWLWGAGQDVITGFWQGIESMGGWLVSKMTSFITDHVPGPIKKALGINSPSRVMAAISKGIPEGIAQGIDDNHAMVAKSMLNLGATAARFTPAIPSASGGAFGGLAGAAAGVDSGGASTVYNITIEGSIRTTRDFADELEEIMLQKGLRRGSSYASYSK